jgi:hypothetical protein
MVSGEQGKDKYPVRQYRALHTESRMQQDTFETFVFCHFIKDPVLKSITPCNIISPSVCRKHQVM